MCYICHYCFGYESTKNSYITLKIPFELYGHTMVPNVLVPPRSLEIRRGRPPSRITRPAPIASWSRSRRRRVRVHPLASRPVSDPEAVVASVLCPPVPVRHDPGRRPTPSGPRSDGFRAARCLGSRSSAVCAGVRSPLGEDQREERDDATEDDRKKGVIQPGDVQVHWIDHCSICCRFASVYLVADHLPVRHRRSTRRSRDLQPRVSAAGRSSRAGPASPVLTLSPNGCGTRSPRCDPRSDRDRTPRSGTEPARRSRASAPSSR